MCVCHEGAPPYLRLATAWLCSPRVRGIVSGTTRDRGGVRPWLDTSLGIGGDRNGAQAAGVLRIHRGVADRGGRPVGQQGATSLTLRTDGQTPRYAAQRKAVNRAVNRGPPRLPCGRPSGQPLRRDVGQSAGGHLAYPVDGPAAFSTGEDPARASTHVPIQGYV